MKDINKTVGEKINTLLACNNIKQKDLAKILCVPDNTISYYCSGARIPNVSQLIKIAEFFDVSVDSLLGHNHEESDNELILKVCAYTGLDQGAVLALRKHYGDALVSQIITSEAFDELIYSFHDCVDHADMLTRSMTAISNGEYKNGEIPSLSHLLEAIKYERYAFIEICTKILDELVPYQEKVNAANVFLYECEEQLEKEWYAREDTQKYKDELTRTKKKMEEKHGISAPKEE